MNSFTMRTLTIAVLMLSFSPHWPAVAQDRAEPAQASRPVAVSYHQENDSPWLNQLDHTDRYYTHGIAASVTHRPRWSERLAARLPFGRNVTRAGVGYVLAHEMYTPEDLGTDEINEDDRPYAGYAYLGVAHHRASQHSLDQLQLDIGLVGPITHAGEIQTRSHEMWGGRDPRGWHNQLGNEPTLQLWLRRVGRIGLGGQRGFGLQLLPSAELALGSVRRHLQLATLVRVGVNLPDDFGPPRLGASRNAVAEPRPGLGLFAFGGVGGRAVRHNKLISGNNTRTSHGRPVRRAVGTLQAGVGGALRVRSWSLEAVYSQTVVSEEFYGQNGRHRYGSAVFTISGPHRHR